MARGRNAGFDRLLQIDPEIEFVQFVDGDCEVELGWIDAALSALKPIRNWARSAVIDECFPETKSLQSPDVHRGLGGGPAGEVAFCGGDVLMRVEAFRQTGGYMEHMIAGEDPEICVRLQHGWKLRRLDIPMTQHDVAMQRFGQWWKRTVRSGHAFAEGAWMHRNSTERPWRREVRSNFFWGLILPLLIIAFAIPTYGLSLMLCLMYPVWVWKITRWRQESLGDSTSDAWLYGAFCMFGKFPSALGQLLFYWRMLTLQKPRLIEYKTTDAGK